MEDFLNHPGQSFEYVRSKKRISAPVGGVEQNIAIFLNSQPGNLPESLKNKMSHDENACLIYNSWLIIEGCLSATSDIECYLFALNDTEIIGQAFLPSGDLLRLEGFWDDIQITEICTGEFRDSTHLCLALHDLKLKIRKIFAKYPELQKLYVASHPGFFPRLGRRNHFRLGFHINLYKDDSPYLIDTVELESALSCLMPFISSGGIGPAGFCISPLSSAYTAGSNLIDRHDPALSYRVSVKKSARIGRKITEEERFHIPFDPPYSLEGAAMSFSTAQLLVVMSSQGYAPLKGLKLKNPAKARKMWSENPDSQCALRTRKRVSAWDLLLVLRSQIFRFLETHSIPESLEATAEKLIKGSLAAASDGGNFNEYLIHRFEYFAKRYLYERLFRDYFGISLERFSTLMSILFRLGIPAKEIVTFSPVSLKRVIARLSPCRLDLISGLMRENRVDYADLITGAHVYKKVEAIEFALGRIYPQENECFQSIEKEYVKLIEKKSAPKREPTRADARRRIIHDLKTVCASGSLFDHCESDTLAFCMDWSNFFGISVHDDFIRLYIQPMGEPGSHLLEPPFRLDLKPEVISQISHSVPGGKLFVKLISKAVDTYMFMESCKNPAIRIEDFNEEANDAAVSGEKETESSSGSTHDRDEQTQAQTHDSVGQEEETGGSSPRKNPRLFD